MSSIMQYNGAAVIAMAGKECIAIASDRRYGIRNQTMGAAARQKLRLPLSRRARHGPGGEPLGAALITVAH